ncbi:MAG TPA: GMP synthase (glutamine-hydrolyzing), partial [Candidatus Diapherotrites archaeon]|nr:GMP synthase (glutamine-hydrolyzing) [Candidatus Diapherotrites archaeon]
MADKELVLILDFGGQYNQLIARRVREANVYCEVVPYDYSLDEIRKKNPKGIIFTGGPASVYEEGAPRCDPGVFGLGVPILGICYGA